jgi:LDH2 family malate/lactate/ureidoglycolate dehydrogenase
MPGASTQETFMEVVRVDEQELRATVQSLFESFDLPTEDAEVVADALVEADLMGISSHGVSNYIQLLYVPGLERGTIAPRPELEIVSESACTALVDGGGGMGHVVGARAMRLAIEKAAEHGIGLVSVRNSRHYGAAGYYSKLALAEDMIGLSLTNADGLVTPTHGKEAKLGTNPIAVAVPTGRQPPFLLDMATSTVPLGKIMLAMREGREIPLGWAADAEGRPTTDPKIAFEAMNLLPLGGTYEQGSHKGYGLGVVIDVLCGLLSGQGAARGEAIGTSMGHFFGALDVSRFLPVDEFKAAMDEYLERLQQTTASHPEEPVIYAGIKEARARAERQREGIPLHAEVVAYLRGLCRERRVESRL